MNQIIDSLFRGALILGAIWLLTPVLGFLFAGMGPFLIVMGIVCTLWIVFAAAGPNEGTNPANSDPRNDEGEDPTWPV